MEVLLKRLADTGHEVTIGYTGEGYEVTAEWIAAEGRDSVTAIKPTVGQALAAVMAERFPGDYDSTPAGLQARVAELEHTIDQMQESIHVALRKLATVK